MNFTRLTYSPLAQMVAATAIFTLVLSLTYGAPFVSAQGGPGGNPNGNNGDNGNCPTGYTKLGESYNGGLSWTADADYESVILVGGPDNQNNKDPNGRNKYFSDVEEGETISRVAHDISHICVIPSDDVPVCDDEEALNYGEEGDCEYEESGSIKVWKKVVGLDTNPTYSDFSFTVDGGAPVSFPNPTTNYVYVHDLSVGTHTILEVPVSGYYTTYDEVSGYGSDTVVDAGNCSISVENDTTKYCRITNTVDMCPNIDGPQTEVPRGMYKDQSGNCVDIPECVDEPNGGWSDSVITYTQEKRLDHSSITDPNRTDVMKVIGVADWVATTGTNFFSLGFGGTVTVKFDSFVPDSTGNDISIHEATNGSEYPEESAKVEVSQDGVTWKEIGTASNQNDLVTRVTYLDFASTGWAWIKYVRVTDTSDKTDFTGTYNNSNMPDGFDLDAVDATKTVCDEPGDEPQVCTVVLQSGVDANTNSEDDSTTVVEKSGALAKLVSYIHPAWTAAMGTATWIWGDNPVADPVGATTQTFVRNFGWGGTAITSATLEIASDNSHSYDLNGSIGGSVDENNHALGTQDSYTVTPAIQSGNNTLEIAVDNWAQQGGTTESNPAGLMYRLTIVGEGEDCEIPYEEEDDTTITVKKIVEEGCDTETEFNFELNDVSFASLAHSESKTKVVEPGSYKVEEIVREEWDLEDVSCVDEDKKVVGSWDGAWYLELKKGDDVTCTFVNEEDDNDPDPKVCRIGENLMVNGSFEEPVISNDWTIATNVPGWSYDTDGIEIWRNFNGSGAGLASNGFQNVELDGNSSTAIQQTVATVPGTVYELRFDFSPRAGIVGNSLDARADGNLVKSVSADGSSNSGNEWEDYSGTFVATDASTIISFEDTASSDSLGTLLDHVVLCKTSEVPLYTIDGYKWKDVNGDGEWQRDGENGEPGLEGWIITVTNGDIEYSTMTDKGGYYSFSVPAGSWTVTEMEQVGWKQTFPTEDNSGACLVTFGDYVYASVNEDDVTDDYDWSDSAECNFGNTPTDEDPELSCDISASASAIDEGDDVTIFWSTTLADGVTLNGSTVTTSGSQLFEDLEVDTTFTIVATEDVIEDEDNVVECSVTIEVDEDRGGSSSGGSRKKRSSSSDNDPVGEVLGEATSVLPVGAPDTGAGGGTQSPFASLVALFGMLMSLVTIRMTKNVG